MSVAFTSAASMTAMRSAWPTTVAGPELPFTNARAISGTLRPRAASPVPTTSSIRTLACSSTFGGTDAAVTPWMNSAHFPLTLFMASPRLRSSVSIGGFRSGQQPAEARQGVPHPGDAQRVPHHRGGARDHRLAEVVLGALQHGERRHADAAQEDRVGRVHVHAARELVGALRGLVVDVGDALEVREFGHLEAEGLEVLL